MNKEKELFSNVFYSHDKWFNIVGATMPDEEKIIAACDDLIDNVEAYKKYFEEIK